MVYNKEGTALADLYNVSGSEIIQAYNIDGQVVFEQNPIVIEDIPEYFRTTVSNALSHVDSLGNGYVHFLVTTDNHFNMNWMHNAVILNYLYQSGKFDKLIDLGDLLENGNVGSTNWNSAVNNDFFKYKQWLFTQGNHDSGLSPLATACSYFESQQVHYTTHTYHNAWRYDNDAYKIRFIGLHHYLFANSAIREDVQAWVQNRPTGYKWLLVNHYPFNTEGLNAESTSCIGEDAANWLKGLVESYGGFIGNFCGHLHRDSMLTVSTPSKTFYQMVFDFDAKGGISDGSIDSQCITVLSINPTTQNVKMYRIGRNRQSLFTNNVCEFTGFAN